MKKISLLLILASIICGINVQAQISFSKEYGGPGNEDGRWMEQLADSGFILVGGTDYYSNGQSDIWLVRTDAYGNQLWTKSIGTTAFDFANMVKPVPGGFVICGKTNFNGTDDAWILKTDTGGNIIWSTVLIADSTQWFEGFIPTSDGGYAAIGINNGVGTHGTYDAYLVKFNGSGVKQWEKFIGGQSYEIGNSIQQTSDGGFIIGGQTYSYGNLDGDFYLVKTNSSGVVQWEKTFGQPHLQECHYAQITPDGGFILVGDADTLTNGLGDTDVWLIKTDSTGTEQWDKIYGGTKKDGGKTVENTTDGGFIVAGITRSFGLVNPNFYLFKTDGSGTLQWQKTNYGTAYHDHAYRAIETSDYGFAEFGFFRNSAGFQNYALVKLPPNAGIVKDLAIDAIAAPNPIICRSNNVPLGVVLTNYGATNEQNITVTMQIDNGSYVTTLLDTFVGSLAPSTSTTLNFTPTYNFNLNGTYNIKAFIQHRNSDISYTNDTSAASFSVIAPTADPTTTSAVSCTNGSLTLTSTAAASADSMFWYDAPVNGNLVMTGNTYTTPSLSSTTTYYVQSVKGKGKYVGPTDNTIGAGTTSSTGYLKFDSRTEFILESVYVYPLVAGNRTIELRNSAGTVLQSKTVNLPAAAGGMRVYLNFDVPIGNDYQLGLSNGSAALFRNSAGAVYTYSVSQTVEIYGTNSSNAGTYYYFYNWYIFVPSENCASNRIPVQAIIGSTPTTAFDGSRCGSGSVTLTANSTASLAWYSASTGGSSLATGNTFTTPALSSSTTYYLDINSCPNRIAVNAAIHATSATPVATDVTRCGPGTVNLTATSSDPVFWYNAPSGGTLMHSGTPYTTPFLDSTTTYYLVAGSVCPSTPIPINAIINAAVIPTVTGASACGPASVTVTASSPDPITWYSVPNGGTSIGHTSSYTTPVISTPTTYYAEAGTVCPSPRVAVVANVTVTDPPVGTGASRCGSGSLVISAQSLNPVSWWTASTGGTQLSNGAIYTTMSLTQTTIYYAMATANGCNSTRTAVYATINITTPPTVSPGYHCGPGHVTLSASASDSIFWYTASTGGTLLQTGSTYTTPSISTTHTYYVQAGGVCPSSRVAVDAVISSTAPNPVTSGGSHCGTGIVTLSATSTDSITWYDAPGGNIVGTGTTFHTPTLSASTTYYAVAGITGCLSSPVPTVAAITSPPADPVTTGNNRCGAGSVIISATSPDSITWLDAPGGTVLGTGSAFQTPSVSSTTTFYAVAGDTGCRSNAVPAVALINPLAADPVVAGAHNCGPGQLTLSATSPDSLTWFSQSSGGSPITTGTSFTSNFNTTTTVYVQAYNGTCPSNRIAVTATIYNQPNVNLGPPVVNISSGQSITLDAGAGYASYQWNTHATTRTISVNSTGVYIVVVTDSHGCQGTDTITVNVLTGINEISLENSLEIYPNPTQGIFNVVVNNTSARFELRITDLEGRIILTDTHKNAGLFNKTYNLSEFAKGIYFLQISSPDGNVTKRIIIQ